MKLVWKLKKSKEQLTNMVPYRALAGFFVNAGEIVNWDSIRRMNAYIKASSKATTSIYQERDKCLTKPIC